MRLLKAFTVIISLLLLSLPLSVYSHNSAHLSLGEQTFSYMPELEHQKNPNKYCTRCHKFTKQQFHGTHLSQKNPNNGKDITCVNCHGNISELHRRGVKDVMRFQGDIFSKDTPMYTAQEQNQVCFACHQPDKLRKAFWVHDVHAMKLPCSSCHTLHPKHDAMRELAPKNRVQLCVDCHGKQQKLFEQKQAKSTQLQKETP